MINRHVVAKELTQSYIIFGTSVCECSITSCYVDSIYDFANCKYKVTNLKNFNLKQIKLKPKLVKMGLEIRVYNNDKSEVLSILPNVISKVDHNLMS